MNAKELKELIEFLIEKDVAEFELERGDVKMRMKRGGAVQASMAYPSAPSYGQAPLPQAAPQFTYTPTPAPSPAAAAAPSAPAEPAEEVGVHIVRSPIVGTFYEAPSPGAPPFVKNGDHVQSGQTLCIIEAMKLMNEIESDATGEIVRRYVDNAQPVEYGQPLFAIRAS